MAALSGASTATQLASFPNSPAGYSLPVGRRAKTRNSNAHPNPAAPFRSRIRVIEMLQRPQGTPIATIMKATGWQQHSVRGFFAAVVRKKLGLNLVSTKCDNERVYRIVPKETSRKSKSHNGT
jgi:hypothetical protein